MQKIPIRRDSLDQLQEELKQLKTVERPQIIKAISEAREHGDLSENAEYHAARERQSFVEGRVGELEDVISRAEVINTEVLSGDKIIFGATVTLGIVGKKKNMICEYPQMFLKISNNGTAPRKSVPPGFTATPTPETATPTPPYRRCKCF